MMIANCKKKWTLKSVGVKLFAVAAWAGPLGSSTLESVSIALASISENIPCPFHGYEALIGGCNYIDH
jgi:hypothetical protein